MNPIPKNDILKMLWIGSCTISEYTEIKDPVTHVTSFGLVPVVENEPCRLSYSKDNVTDMENSVAGIQQTIKLFIRPDIDIKAGSIIEVTQHGTTNKYKRASEPAIYTNHQEVILEIDKDV